MSQIRLAAKAARAKKNAMNCHFSLRQQKSGTAESRKTTIN